MIMHSYNNVYTNPGGDMTVAGLLTVARFLRRRTRVSVLRVRLENAKADRATVRTERDPPLLLDGTRTTVGRVTDLEPLGDRREIH